MSNEWDEINNGPEDNDVEDNENRETVGADSYRARFNDTSIRGTEFSGYETYTDTIRSSEIIRISTERDFECRRHGRVQSFRLTAAGLSSMHHREVGCCIHCFMDLLVHRCHGIDSERERPEEEGRVNRADYGGERQMQTRGEQ